MLAALLSLAAAGLAPSCDSKGQASICDIACAADCRGFPPGFGATGCIQGDYCTSEPPEWARGSLCSCSASPTPTPTPPKPPTPSKPPTPTPVPSSGIVGYWDTTWSPVDAPAGANIGIAFSGWNSPTNALSESNAVKSFLIGAKWIDAGGGGYNGRWNADYISQWESLITSGGLSSWAGIVLDVEECFDAGLAQNFGSLLRAAKTAGLGTMVTTSHSAPYLCDDARELMLFFFASDDCDYLSPQLYAEGGDEGEPSFVVTSGSNVAWADWVGAKPKFAPSLTKPAISNGAYAKTQQYFADLGITCAGYVDWPTATLREKYQARQVSAA